MRILSTGFTNRVIGVGCVAALIMAAGCSTPSTGEIQDAFAKLKERITANYHAKMAACDQLTGQERLDCRSETVNEYHDQLDELTQANQDALDKNWEAARDRRKSLEDNLTKDGLQPVVDAIDAIIPDTPQLPQQGSFAGGFASMIIGGGGVPTTDEKTWLMNGTFAFEYDGQMIPTTVAGSIDVTLDPPAQNGSRNGSVDGGYYVLTLPNAETVSFTIVTGNDEYVKRFWNGNGMLDFVADVEYSDVEWAALMPSRMWIRTPISLTNGDNTLNINHTGADPSNFYPYQPRAYTDYDGDGVYDLAADGAAFVTAFGVQDYRADINVDSVWDSEDISLWQLHFAEDAANQ